MFRDIESVHELRHVKLSVASHECCNVSVLVAVIVICHEKQRFYRLFLVQAEEIRNFIDRLGSWSVHFFHRKHLNVVLSLCIHTLCPFHGSCHGTFFTVCDLTLAHFRNRRELVRIAAAYSAGVSLYRSEVKSAPREDLLVRFVHVLIALVETFLVAVERIRVLHDELSAPHQSESRSCLVSVLRLDLVKIHRQLSVGVDVCPHDVCEYLLMRRSEAELTSVSVLYSPELRSVRVPSAGFLPELRRLDSRHMYLLSSCSVHLFSDYSFDLSQRPPSERHEAVNA